MMCGFCGKIRRAGVCAAAFFVVASGVCAAISPQKSAVSERGESAENISAGEKYFGANTEFFSFSGDDSTSVPAATEIAREIETYFVRTRDVWGKILVPADARIRVELFHGTEIFRFSRDDAGRITLFSGGDFTSREGGNRLRERLVEALLTQLFLADFPADSRRVPAWLVCAVAEESRIGSSVGRQIFLRKISAGIEPISPRKLLAAAEEDFSREEFRVNAVWFLRGVGESAPKFVSASPEARERVLNEAFSRFFRKEKINTENVGVFWATRFRALVASEPTGMDLLEESAKFFDEAMLFRVASGDGNDNRVLGADLIRSRLDSEIRALVAARLETFVKRFRKVNPVWHNAFAEYGVFLEMFGNPDVSDETLSAQWNKAVLARAGALELQREIKAILAAPAEN